MKKFCIFFLVIFNLQASASFSPLVFNEMEKIIKEQSRELNAFINDIRLREVYIAFYTTGEFIEQKEKLLKSIELDISKNSKVKVINYGDTLSNNNRNSYILKLDFVNPNYKNTLGLKKEFFGISTLELIQNSTDLVIFTSYKPINISIKKDYTFIILLSLGLFLLGLLASFGTKKYYTFEIMGFSMFIIIVFNVYFHAFL